jgi:hypothetical protein
MTKAVTKTTTKAAAIRDVLRRKWYVEERLRVLLAEKKMLAGGAPEADKRAQSKRRAYVKFRREALLAEFTAFRAERKQIKGQLQSTKGG